MVPKMVMGEEGICARANTWPTMAIEERLISGANNKDHEVWIPVALSTQNPGRTRNAVKMRTDEAKPSHILN